MQEKTWLRAVKIKEISSEETLGIRQRVLWPNKPRRFCVVDGDDVATHYGIFIDNRLVGLASNYDDSGSVRLRKFAVESEFQGLGLGTALLTHIIEKAGHSGSSKFWCDARESALGFYSRFGLHPEGERFYKSGEPYFRMSVRLEG